MEELADFFRDGADLFRATADRFMASGDNLMTDLADRYRAMADRRMAYSNRLRALSYQSEEGDQLGAKIPPSESAIAKVLKRVSVDADEKEDSEESSEEEGGDMKRRKVSEKETCCVCLEEFQKGGLEVASMPCPHSFHHKCIATWLKRSPSCPLCRHEVILLD